MTVKNIFDNEKLILELKELHKLLVGVYQETFEFKYKNDEEFNLFIEKEYKENGVAKKDRKAWNDNFCHRASYTLLNKILFVRICEDKGFMLNPEDYIAGQAKDIHIGEKLTNVGLQKWTSLVTHYTLGELVKLAFKDMKASYSNIVLYKEDKYEILNPRDEELSLKYINGNEDIKELVLEFERVLSSIIEKLDTNKFNFKYTDGNILGDVYEKFMDRETRKAIGQFYTPEFVIEYILKNTVEEADVLENPFTTVADISCGSGHFLIMAYDILKDKFLNNIQELKQKYADEDYIIKKNGEEIQLTGIDYWVKEHIHYHILKHCIYGADIDSFAVQLTTINLILKDLDNFTDELNIIECDSLIKWEKDYDWKDLKRQLEEEFETNIHPQSNLFGEDKKVIVKQRREKFKLINLINHNYDKELDKDEVSDELKLYEFWNRKFDYVVGNPPYIRYEKIKLEVVNYVKEQYETAYKFFDIFSIFIERNIEICKRNHYISLITPSLYIKGLDYSKLRKYILENSKDIDINDLGDNVFEDVQMPTAIIKILRDKMKVIEGEGFTIFDEDPIINKIKRNKKLEKVCEIRRGLELGKKSLHNKEHNNTLKILTGEDIERYGIKSFKYIDKKLISENNKDEKYFELERVLIRETGNRITTISIEKKMLSLRSLYSIISNPKIIDSKALCGILNSDLIQYFYSKEYKANTDIFPKIRIGQVKEIPICTNEKEVLQKITLKVDEIQYRKKYLLEMYTEINKILINEDNFLKVVSYLTDCLKNRDMYIVEAISLEGDINKLVYELYSINQTEIITINKELAIEKYNVTLEELERKLPISVFLEKIKRYSLYEIKDLYKCDMKIIIDLRNKYEELYKANETYSFYNTKDIIEKINMIITDTVESIFIQTRSYINHINLKKDIEKRLCNFENLINIVRLDKNTVSTQECIKEALSKGSYTWNAYRKDKSKENINKRFIKYYDNTYYGLSEWSDEIHKKYFLDAIEEYTQTKPNEKKAKDILKLFKDLDIKDKDDYIDIIEEKIKKAFH